MGKVKTKTKLIVIYLCIDNINYENQCKRDDISLVRISRTSEIESAMTRCETDMYF